MARRIRSGRSGYLSLVHRCPKLTREREVELVSRWRGQHDQTARDELVRSQLRHVVAIARRYGRGSGAMLDELIAEGNFGLLQAMVKFDPALGTRFVTYAVYWIRAYISQYLQRSRSLVTTGVNSKMLSKIRRERQKLLASTGATEDSDARVAERLAISPEKLRSLAERLDVRDVVWDGSAEEASNGSPECFASLSPNPEDRILSGEAEHQLSLAISNAVALLSDRERFVVEHRHMAHPDDQLCLAEIGRRFRVSRERARQIEAAALRKLKTALVRSTARTWLVHRSAA